MPRQIEAWSEEELMDDLNERQNERERMVTKISNDLAA